jgi:B9 domain-containing protein 2
MAATGDVKEYIRVSVIGQIVGASALGYSCAHCSWRLVAGDTWKHVSGALSGESQSVSATEDGVLIWQHPVDACFESRAGATEADCVWPHVEVEVRWRDSFDRSDLVGYTVVQVPSRPGAHELSSRVWRPRGSAFERFSAFFVGGRPHLKEDKVIFGIPQNGADDSKMSLARAMGQSRLVTESGGFVHYSLGVCLQRRYDAPDDEP